MVKHLEKSFSALFLVKKAGNYQEVLLDNNIPAWIKTKKDLRGQIKRIKINQQKKDELFGKLTK